LSSLHAVVLAGGPGERFWPVSTPGRPKPFVRLFGDESLLRQTLRRARDLAGAEARVWLVGSRAHAGPLRAEAEGLVPDGNLLLEPVRRDTAAAVAYAAARLTARDPQALLAVLPSDHHIGDPAAFAQAVRRACTAATRGFLCCLGMPALRPETRFGYILRGVQEVAPGVFAAERFVEKPPAEEAERLLATGRAYWNGGVLVCRATELRQAFGEMAPEFAVAWPVLAEADGAALEEAFAALPSISLDYAVLQKARRVAVAPAACRWHDVGSWPELRHVQADDRGNFVRGPVRLVDVSDSVVYNSGERPVVVAGLRGVLVVAAEGHVTLVAPLESDVRRLLQRLAAEGGVPTPDPLGALRAAAAAAGPSVRVVDKPWGGEIVWAHSSAYAAKVIWVHAGHSLSRQYHREKSETHWYLRGSGLLEHGERRTPIRPGLVATIGPGEVHRVRAWEDVCFLEVSTPQLEDVVRLEDVYGRAP
jgi:mannose-1-phosphate guanylyltransferase